MKTFIPFLGLIAALFLFDSCRFGLGRIPGTDGEVVEVPFTIRDTSNCSVIFGVQGTLCFSNPEAFYFIGATEHNSLLWDLDYNENTRGFSISAENTAQGVAVEPGDTLFSIIIQLTGVTGDFSTIRVCQEAINRRVICGNNGTLQNRGYGSTVGRVEIQDSILIAGKIRTINDPDEGISDVDVRLSSTFAHLQAVSDGEGHYNMGQSPTGHYWYRLTRETPSGTPLSTLGMLAIDRHIQGQQLLPPLYIIAADVNCDRQVDQSDLDLYNLVLLGYEEGFNNCPLWHFIPENVEFADPLNPFPELYNRSITLLENHENLNFIGIEVGIIDPTLAFGSNDRYLTLGREEELENHLTLYQNVPNPFSTETTIAFDLPSDEGAELLIYDASGRKVKSLSGPFMKGYNQVRLNGLHLQPGIYYCVLQSAMERRQIKLIYQPIP